MLKLKVYGSSSSGNCFILDDGNEQIMIDCGVSKIENKIDVSKLNAILLSHKHLDHTKGIKTLKNYYNKKIYSNNDTLATLPILDNQKEVLNEEEKVIIGNFIVLPFNVYHDATNYGYLIKHIPSNMKILYIIDTSSISNLSFKDIDVFIIEANHSYSWIEDKEELDFKDIRTYGNQGHLAIEDTIDFLELNVNHNTKKIVLTHISRSFDDYKSFENLVKGKINNTKIEVIAINPKLKDCLEITLKEDLDFNFD